MRVDWATLPFPAPCPAPAEDTPIQHWLLGFPVPPPSPAPRWGSQHWDNFSPFPGLLELGEASQVLGSYGFGEEVLV